MQVGTTCAPELSNVAQIGAARPGVEVQLSIGIAWYSDGRGTGGCYGKDMVGEHLAQTRADKLTRPPFASTQTMCKAVYEFGGDVAARMSAAS